MTTLDWNRSNELVGKATRILIVAHVSPDGDAIGSMLGLAHALSGMGKTVYTAVDGGVPGSLTFIPGSDEVHAALNGIRDTMAPDLVIAVDCGDESRMGKVGQVALKTGVPLINLDHHRTNTLFGQANLVDLNTVAAAEGVLDWLERLNAPIDTQTAFCLLTGMVTDTLCFRTDNVTAATFGKVQRLMDLGASLGEIVQRTVSRIRSAGFRLWRAVMPTVELEDHVIWAVITHDLYDQADYNGYDDAGLVSTLVKVDDAYIAVVFKQQQGDAVEIGIRAVPGFDTSDIAVSLGGGGHPLASGATIHEALETLVPRVVDLLKAEVRRGSPLVP
ncbi:MAG: bifunctional oligoribonuclease/PAP phosphatase NrnA [Anaerolineae bacterium]|nr:bifunctional oligoribonuclease/PAP phosphatase NrnA [Anaerolineae bacterium]